MRGSACNWSNLLFRHAVSVEGEIGRAHAALMALVFDDFASVRPAVPDADEPWRMFAAFEPSGRCVAALEVRDLPLMLDSIRVDFTGLRRVAVDPQWRGLGLMRELIGPALAWCEIRTPHPTLLYTEEPGIYDGFGFVPLIQHAFVGAAPAPAPADRTIEARVIDAKGEDGLILRLLHQRAPLSRHCGLAGAPDLAVRALLAAEDWTIAYAAHLDALIVYEGDESDLVLVDVIAAAIPSLAEILGALDLAPRRVTTLFTPDRLAWHGDPRPDDTGLMARGTLPPAMTRPFMLPPTAEF